MQGKPLRSFTSIVWTCIVVIRVGGGKRAFANQGCWLKKVNIASRGFQCERIEGAGRGGRRTGILSEKASG